jgi:serine/threonine-protein kinase
MGSVQLARQTALDREVAIKRVLGAAVDADAMAGGLEAEARLLARLNHPHIVRVYELLAAGEDVLLVMEYVPGTDLRQLLAERRIAPAVALGYLEQLAGALDHAHERGVIHRDVKPANVMVRPDGVLKLGDFGVAAIRARRPREAGDGGPVGTPAYMAPELARGDSSVDQRADVYSLAVVAYELLAGAVPFPIDPADPRRTLRAQVDDPPPRPGLPGPLEDALLRGLEKRREARPRSAGEFAAALRAGFEQTGADSATLPPVLPRDDGTRPVVVLPRDGRPAPPPGDVPQAMTLAPPDEPAAPPAPPGPPSVLSRSDLTMSVTVAPFDDAPAAQVSPAPRLPRAPRAPVRPRLPSVSLPAWRPGRGSALVLVCLLAAIVLALASLAVVRLRPAPAPAPASLQVSSVAATVSPGVTGHCPEANFTFQGTMRTSGGAGTITYRWLQPDGQTSTPQSTTVQAGARQATVTLLWKFSGSGSTHGVAALHVTSPIDAYSPPIDVTYTCP